MSSREHTPRESLSKRKSRKHRNDSHSRREARVRRQDSDRESRGSSAMRHRDRSESFESLRRRRDSSYGRRNSPRHDPLNEILNRLIALEDRLPSNAVQTSTPKSSHPCVRSYTPLLASAAADAPGAALETPATDGTATAEASREADAADRIVGALSSLIQVRSKHYYISNFDPCVHNFDVWCAEVDRGRVLCHWDDRECLGRIGGCLRGDAKTWLNDWVTNDRSWTNFKAEFRSLCPREVDMATVLYEVMSTSSGKFTTYAEYARKSLLRLNIVKGLSDELKTAIVIRGISDPQVKAATTNAKLQSKDLVEFLSVYIKPKNAPSATTTNNPVRTSNQNNLDPRKRKAPMQYDRLTCFLCGNIGHKQHNCPKKSKSTETNSNSQSKTEPASSNSQRSSSKPVKTCTFCRKSGHSVETCFTKERVESKSNNNNSSSNVNFCSESPPDKTM